MIEMENTETTNVSVPLGAVTITLTEYRELLHRNAMMEQMLNDVAAYANGENYLRADVINKMLGVNGYE